MADKLKENGRNKKKSVMIFQKFFGMWNFFGRNDTPFFGENQFQTYSQKSNLFKLVSGKLE